jgi:hypothetical protein
MFHEEDRSIYGSGAGSLYLSKRLKGPATALATPVQSLSTSGPFSAI